MASPSGIRERSKRNSVAWRWRRRSWSWSTTRRQQTDKPEEQVVALMCFKKDYPPYRPSGYNIAIINGLLFSPRGTHTHKHTRWKKNPFDLQKESLHRHWKGTKANHLVQSDGKATVVSQNIQSVLWCVLLCPQLGSTRVEIGKILLPWVKWLI